MNILLNSAPKGQKANSPGRCPGDKDMVRFALTGRRLRTTFTQGVALRWELTGLSGRIYWLAKLEIVTLDKLQRLGIKNK